MARFRFGEFVLDTEAGVLELGGAMVDLRPKLVETLIPLVEAAPAVVLKGTLMQRVWPETHVVESALIRNISELRQRFAEDFGERTVIETVAKRGYRFAITVVREDQTPEPDGVAVSANEAPQSKASSRKRLLGVLVLGCGLIGVFGLGSLWKHDGPAAGEKSQNVAKSRDLAMQTFRSGFAHYDRWTPESMAEAEAEFRKTVSFLPDDWFGYYGLTSTLLAKRILSGAAFAGDWEVRRVSELGVHFGPRVAVTHSVRGAALLLLDWNWEEAEQEIEAGIRWNPKNHVPLAYRGALRIAEGRNDDATSDFDAALRLKTDYDEGLMGKAFARYYAGDFRSASAQLKELLPHTNKRQAVLLLQAVTLGAQERFAEAAEALATARPSPLERLRTEAWLAARAGRPEAALLRTQFESACRENFPYCDTASIDTALGRHESAIASIEEAVRLRHWKALFLARDPLLKPLHSNPRWAGILRQLGQR